MSDLLAWTHQTLATEADVARGLFGDDGLKALVSAAVERARGGTDSTTSPLYMSPEMARRRATARLGRLTEDAAAAHGVACVCGFYADALATKIGRASSTAGALENPKRCADGGRRRAAVGAAARSVDARRDAAPARKALDVAEAIVRADARGPCSRPRRRRRPRPRAPSSPSRWTPSWPRTRRSSEAEVARDSRAAVRRRRRRHRERHLGDADAVVATAAPVLRGRGRRVSQITRAAFGDALVDGVRRALHLCRGVWSTCAREAASRLLQ